jgi:tRNA(Ile2) C34 agmatinyltransferase TiaS
MCLRLGFKTEFSLIKLGRKQAAARTRNNCFMLVELIVDLFIEVPLEFLYRIFRGPACPKCGNRLKYAGRGTTDQIQCVMCDRNWRKEGQTFCRLTRVTPDRERCL